MQHFIELRMTYMHEFCLNTFHFDIRGVRIGAFCNVTFSFLFSQDAERENYICERVDGDSRSVFQLRKPISK